MPDLTDVQLLQSIWAALRRIEDNMALPPAPLELPPINIAPPDLADVVTAVTSLKPGPTAEEIAVAIAGVLSPSDPQPDGSGALEAVAAALEKLDFRLKGMGVQAYGGGAVSLEPGQTIATTTSALATVASSQVSVPATQVAVPATNQPGRKTVSIRALTANAQPVYLGLTGVTATTGWELSAGDSIDLDADANVNLFCVASSGTQRVSCLEIA